MLKKKLESLLDVDINAPEDLKKLVDEVMQITANAVVEELKIQDLLKLNETPLQKTEKLLYSYNSLKESVENKEIQLKILEEQYGDICEIESVRMFIKTSKSYIALIDVTLYSLQNEPYFEIVVLKYFEGRTDEEIARYFDVDPTTISRNTKKLLNILQTRFYSDEVIFNILYG